MIDISCKLRGEYVTMSEADYDFDIDQTEIDLSAAANAKGSRGRGSGGAVSFIKSSKMWYVPCFHVSACVCSRSTDDVM